QPHRFSRRFAVMDLGKCFHSFRGGAASLLLQPSGRVAHPMTFSPGMSVAGNDLRVFTESPPLYASMISDIQGARSRVWLETYIFLPDAAGQALAGALKERARAGVDVKVLYDALGNHSA